MEAATEGRDLREHLAGVLQQAASRKRQEVQRQIDSALCRSAEQKRAAVEEDSARRAAEQDLLQARVSAAMCASRDRERRGHDAADGPAAAAAAGDFLDMEAHLQSAVAAAQSRSAGGSADPLEFAASFAAMGLEQQMFSLQGDGGAEMDMAAPDMPFPASPLDMSMYFQDETGLVEMPPSAFPMVDSWETPAEPQQGGGSVPIEIARLLPGLSEAAAEQDGVPWSPEQDWHCWAEPQVPAVGSMDWSSQDWMAWTGVAADPSGAQLPLTGSQPPEGLAPVVASHPPVHCSSCGSMFMDSSIFCRRCGQKRGEEPAAAPPARPKPAASQAADYCAVGAPTAAAPQPAGERTASTSSARDAASDSGSDLLAECWQDRQDMLGL